MWTRRLRLKFDNSAMQYSPGVLEVTSGVSEEQNVHVTGSHMSPFKKIIESFVECARDGVEPVTSAEDARRTIDAGAAIMESALKGKPVLL